MRQVGYVLIDVLYFDLFFFFPLFVQGQYGLAAGGEAVATPPELALTA